MLKSLIIYGVLTIGESAYRAYYAHRIKHNYSMICFACNSHFWLSRKGNTLAFAKCKACGSTNIEIIDNLR